MKMCRLAGVVGATGIGIAACGSGGSQSELVLDSEFSGTGASGWLTYSALPGLEGCTDLPTVTSAAGQSYGVSSAPWWTDPNHAAPGLGYLHLVALAYHQDYSVDGVIKPRHRGRPIDLRGASINVRWRAPSLVLPASARFLFWFQTQAEHAGGAPRRVNYVLTARPLTARPVPAGVWQEDELSLSADAGDYTCLGSNAQRADTYGCDIDALHALRDWNINLGFAILFPDSADAARMQGAVEFDRIALRVPDENLDTHLAAPATLSRGPSTCRVTAN